MPTVAFHTLGCKVNQYDSQAMLELFGRAGYEQVDFDHMADVYVINTCAVTGTGDKKSMQAIRRAQRQNPLADIVLCGCVAQRDGENLQKATGARLVIGTARRGEVVDLLHRAQRENRGVCAVEDVTRAAYEPLYITRQQGRTRAVLKIQEGCDRYCAYCIVPYVRGGVRSRPLADIARESRRLAGAGYREVVLTGIHLTSYGRDLQGETLLSAIQAVHDTPGVERVRLGSLEPVIATAEFAQSLAAMPKVCPQFHLALQSGCDDVLRRMRRRYDTAQYRQAAQNLRQRFPDCALTTDVLCGFPGETQDEHAQTIAFCRDMAFARVHVFPYSERPGTAAASMPNQVPKAERERRAKELISLGRGMALAYRKGQLGTVRRVLFETALPGDWCEGYTPEYMRCRVRGDFVGQTRDALLENTDGEGFTGRVTQE